MYNRNPVLISSTTSELLRFSYGILPSLKTSHMSTPIRNGECSTANERAHKKQTNVHLEITGSLTLRFNSLSPRNKISSHLRLIRPALFLKNRDFPSSLVVKHCQAQPAVTSNSNATTKTCRGHKLKCLYVM